MADVENNNNNNNGSTEKAFKLEGELMDKFATMELIRGESPDDIEKRCLDLCKTFLGGSWALATMKDVAVKRISGGLTNQLWHVKLNDEFPRRPNDIYTDEPSEVAIKLFQAKHMQNYHEDDHERLNDIIILTVMAEAGLGPKVYGIFDDGFIQAYHKHEHFRAKHQKDPKLLDECIGKLAKIHHMKVPIRKNTNLVFDHFGRMVYKAYANPIVEQICKEENFTNLLERNLIVEWEIVKKLIAKLNSPTVFCHCDFRGGNILMTDNGIVCVDLEYSNYGSRPYDITTILNEWGKTELFDKTMGKIPNDETIKNFLSIYIDHCERLKPGYKSKPENQLEVLFKETKVFFVVVYFFFLAFMISAEDSIIPGIPFDRKEFIKQTEAVYGFYKIIKKDLYDQGLLDKEDL